MKDWFCRTFTPWRAATLFEDGDAWFAYLVRYDKECNAIRVVLFAVAVFFNFSPIYSVIIAGVLGLVFTKMGVRGK